MKKKLSWIILAVILIVFTGLYAVVDKNNAIYDRETDTDIFTLIPSSLSSLEVNI